MQSIQAVNQNSVNSLSIKKVAIGVLSTLGAASIVNTLLSNTQIKSHVSLRGAVSKPINLQNIDVLKNPSSVHALSLVNPKDNSQRKLAEVARQLSEYIEAHPGECDSAGVNELCIPILAWTGKLIHVAEESNTVKELLATLQEGKTLLTSLNKLLPADSELSDILKSTENLLVSLDATLNVVNNTAEKIGTTSEKVGNTSEKVSDASDTISASTVLIASAVIVIALAVTYIAIKTNQIGNEIIPAAKAVTDAANSIQTTSANANGMITELREALPNNETTQNLRNLLRDLTSTANGISKLTKVGVIAVGAGGNDDSVRALGNELNENSRVVARDLVETLNQSNTLMRPFARVASWWAGNNASTTPAAEGGTVAPVLPPR